MKSGNKDTATCILCHGVHDIKSIVQPGSSISSFNVPDTCGKCHKYILEEYKQSIHWIYARKGIKTSPVCNDCHSEHSISAINTVNKERKTRKIQEETCFHCHQDPVIARRFGLAGNQPHEYQDSYHGLASVRGGSKAALCVDCHGAHKILPKTHPASTINDENITNTCKKCHTNASEVFSRSYSHKTLSASAQRIEVLVKNIYIILIIVVIGGMLLHNFIIFLFELRKRYKKEKNLSSVQRLTVNEIVQHSLLVVSFVLLAFTGFALKFPGFWLFSWMESASITEAIRQYIHRGAGLSMIILGIYHVLYLMITKRGRSVLVNLLPRLCDIKEAVHNILYYLYLRKKKPEFGRYDYTEKMEYWALGMGNNDYH